MSKPRRYTARYIRSLPVTLRELAQAGERVRFHGFWLGPSERDRIVAKWIDEQPNAAELIKTILYMVATGATMPLLEMPVVNETSTEDSGDDWAESSLLNFDD